MAGLDTVRLKAIGPVASVASGFSLSIPYPVGAEAGDLILCVCTATNTATPTVPSGWTAINTNVNTDFVSFWKIASGGESGTVALTWTGTSQAFAGRMFRFSGASHTSPIGAHNTTVVNPGSSISNSLTTNTNGSAAFAFAISLATVSMSGVSGTGWVDDNDTFPASPASHGSALKQMPTAGSTGTVTITFSGSAIERLSIFEIQAGEIDSSAAAISQAKLDSVGTLAAVAAGSSLAVRYPVGISANDFLLIVGTATNSSAVMGATPSGWTAVNTAPLSDYITYWKIADGTESGSVSLTWTGATQDFSARMFRFRDVDTSSPLGAHNTTTNLTDTLTTTFANSLAFAYAVVEKAANVNSVTGTGWTYDYDNTNATLLSDGSAVKPMSAAGATGNVAFTFSASAANRLSIFEIKTQESASSLAADELSDELASEQASSERASSNFLLEQEISSDVLAHEEKSSDDAASSDLKKLLGDESAASALHAQREAASSDLLAAEAASSDLGLRGDAASSDAALQQEIASDIHNAVEAASSDKIVRDALSSNEAASSDLQRAEAASSDQAIIVEGASSDLAVIRAEQSDARLAAEALSSDRKALEAASDALVEERREEASSSNKPLHDAASSDAVNAAGPFFFAWVEEADAFDPILHTREDDDIFAFDIQQQEGDFAALALTVRNPRIGLLAPGRKQWCWFSWRDPQGTLWPLFHGRIIGIPAEIQDNVIQMDFLARPSDFATQKAALAADMQVAPYWDSIWFSDATRDNPDNVLESRPELWHTDRLSLLVTSSNVINGEDGDLDFSTDQVFFDSIHVTYAQNPLRSVTMTASVSWDQIGSGSVTPQRGAGLSSGSSLQSYTGTGLAEAWPKQGATIGGGWSVATSSVSTVGAVDSSLVGEIAYPPIGLSFYIDGGFDTSLGTYLSGPTGNIGWSYHVAIPNVTVTWELTLGWAANRRKSETLSFTLNADVQDIVTMPNDGEVLALTMSSSELNAPIDPDGSIPLGSQTARGYFNTPRGAQSIEYLIAIARAHLLARARAVNVAFEVPFLLWVQSGVTLRKNALIHDDRLPGGTAGGKIIAYALALKDGAAVAAITIGCTVGHDGAVTESRGAPDYCDTDYVDGEIPSSESPSSLAGEIFYQTFAEDFRLPFDTDVAYTSQLGVAPNDDGVDLDSISGRSVLMRLLNGNGNNETQQDALSRFDCVVDAKGSLKATNTRFAQIELTVPDLTGGPFETDYAPTLSDLKVPKTIDMEAPSI